MSPIFIVRLNKIMIEAGVTQQYYFTIPVNEVPVMGWCVPIVMDLSFGELGSVLRAKNDEYLHCCCG